MLATYLGTALMMLVVFALVVYGAPLVYWFFSYMNHVSKGNDFDSYEWSDDDYLSALDEFCDVLGARTADDRAGLSFILILVLSIFWVISIPVVLYFFYTLHSKVKNARYEKVNAEIDARRKANRYSVTDDEVQ